MGRKTKIAVIALALLIIAIVLFFVFVFRMMSGAAPPSPDVRAFGNNRDWVLTEDMIYVVGDTDQQIVVPKGFVTDFASIPESLWSFGLSPHGQYSRAAVVHDYLYWAQPCTRDQADRFLVIAIKESRVGGFDEWAIYAAVDNFGGGPWKKNSKERTAGIPKVIPQAQLRPKDSNMSWGEYRSILASQGVRDPAFEINPAFCKLGDSMLVPSGSFAPTRQTR